MIVVVMTRLAIVAGACLLAGWWWGRRDRIRISRRELRAVYQAGLTRGRTQGRVDAMAEVRRHGWYRRWELLEQPPVSVRRADRGHGA